MKNFETLKHLTNEELQNLAIECRSAYNAEAPAKAKKSKLLVTLIKDAIGIYYMDKFHDVYNSIKSEVLHRFYNRTIN